MERRLSAQFVDGRKGLKGRKGRKGCFVGKMVRRLNALIYGCAAPSLQLPIGFVVGTFRACGIGSYACICLRHTELRRFDSPKFEPG